MYSKARAQRNSVVESAIDLQCLCEEMQKQVDAARFLARAICAALEGLETQPPAGPARAQRAA